MVVSRAAATFSLAIPVFRAYRWLVQREVPLGGIDVFACKRVFRDHLLALPERNTTLVGLVSWLGFSRAAGVP